MVCGSFFCYYLLLFWGYLTTQFFQPSYILESNDILHYARKLNFNDIIEYVKKFRSYRAANSPDENEVLARIFRYPMNNL
jgi:hypothetical protein